MRVGVVAQRVAGVDYAAAEVGVSFQLASGHEEGRRHVQAVQQRQRYVGAFRCRAIVQRERNDPWTDFYAGNQAPIELKRAGLAELPAADDDPQAPDQADRCG